MFRKLDSVFVLRSSLLSWVQSVDLVRIFGEFGFYLRTETEPSLRNVVLKYKTGRWKMFEKLIILLKYNCHVLLDLIYSCLRLVLTCS
jgi:hypothetical protein